MIAKFVPENPGAFVDRLLAGNASSEDTDQFFKLVTEIAEDGEILQQQPFSTIIATPDAWGLFEDTTLDCGPQHMTDSEIAETIIEDVLAATAYERIDHKDVSFKRSDLVRHVHTPSLQQKILNIFDNHPKSCLLQIGSSEIEDPEIRINSAFWLAAQEYCGVYHDDI